MKISKEYYANRVRKHHYTLVDLAKEQGISVSTAKQRIRKAYKYGAWAEKLIFDALQNERSAQKSKNASNVENAKKYKKIPALVDTSALLNYPEWLDTNKYNLFIPAFCKKEAHRIIETERNENPESAELHQRILEAIPMTEIYETSLPLLNGYVGNVKSRNVMYVRYFLRLKEMHSNAVYLSCSREVKHIMGLQ